MDELLANAEDDLHFITTYGNTVRVAVMANDVTLDVFTVLPDKDGDKQEVIRKARIVIPIQVAKSISSIMQNEVAQVETDSQQDDTSINKWARFDALQGAWEGLEIDDNFVENIRQISGWQVANDFVSDD